MEVLGRTFSSLRSRNFRLFFIGQGISNSGNWLTTVALGLLVLHRTGSGTAVGVLAVCQYGPLLVLAPWAGLVADRSNKRRLLCLTQSLEMAQSFVLAGLAATPHSPLPAQYLTALLGGCLLAFDNPARRSFVSEMVPTRQVPNAVTLYSAMNALSRVLGPTVAGALVVTLGYAWCFAIDGLSYLVVLASLVLMRERELLAAPPTQRGRGQVREGLRYVAAAPGLRSSFLMLLIIGVASYNFTVVLPLFTERGLRGSDTQYTLMYAAFSLGGLLGTMVVARREVVRLRTIVAGAAAFGAALLLLGCAPSLAVAYPLAVLVGGTSVAYLTATTAFTQLQARRDMVGRVLALQTVLQLGTTPIGGPILGLVADVFGGRSPVLVGGAAALAATAVGMSALRRPETSSPDPGRPDPDRPDPDPGDPDPGDPAS